MSKTGKIWDRLPEETVPAYDAFLLYRDMPPGDRSIEGLSRTSKYKKGTMSKWSRDNNWVDRVKIWDESEYKKRVSEYEKQKKEDRLKNRVQRNTTLKLYFSQILKKFKALEDLENEAIQEGKTYNLDALELQRVGGAVAHFMAESRTEFDDLPTHRLDVNNPDNEKPIGVAELGLEQLGMDDLRKLARELEDGLDIEMG